jgi:hypothetical protein
LRFRRASSSLHSGNDDFETLGYFACRRSFPPAGLEPWTLDQPANLVRANLRDGPEPSMRRFTFSSGYVAAPH